jgi:hypothetical protein
MARIYDCKAMKCYLLLHAAQNHSIIGPTAAYAAVLVVFVGTTTPCGDLSNEKIAGRVVGVVDWLHYLVLGVAFTIAGPTIVE